MEVKGDSTGPSEAQAKGDAPQRLPPVGFWSYARQDDELSDGRLTRLRVLLAQELQQQYGRERVQLFQDMNAIAHGSDWEREIRKALDQSTFFIPILTPNFIQSEWCCREVALFLEREAQLRTAHPDLGDSGRIFPILFIGMDDADPEDPAILASLQKLQWFDFRRYRHRSFEEPEVREALSELATNMRTLLKTRLGPGTRRPAPTPQPAADSNDRPGATIVAGDKALPARGAARGGGRAREIEVGDRLNNIFEVKRFIKAGGMGQVYEGANIMTGERVAIKTLLPQLAADPRVTAMFQREAMTLTRLNHEALVQYRVLAEEPELGLLYIVTEYVDGVDLSEVLDKADRSEAALRELLARLAAGLAAAHRLGAIHRDISPDNIMLPGGDLHQAKIIDFGIAKDLGGNLPTIVGKGFAGKLNYVAPEQLGDHDGEIGPWTDVYSLALVILSAAQGAKVDMAGSFADAIRKRRQLPDLSAAPANLRPLLTAMLQVDPADRLRSMDAVIERLADSPAPATVHAEKVAPARGLAAGARPAGTPRSKPWLWVALGLAMLVVAVVLIRSLLASAPEQPSRLTAENPAPAPLAAAPDCATERALGHNPSGCPQLERPAPSRPLPSGPRAPEQHREPAQQVTQAERDRLAGLGAALGRCHHSVVLSAAPTQLTAAQIVDRAIAGCTSNEAPIRAELVRQIGSQRTAGVMQAQRAHWRDAIGQMVAQARGSH